MFSLIFSIFGGGASAFLGWFLNYLKAHNYDVPSAFGWWSIFFYVAAVAVVLVGIIVFICDIITCRPGGKHHRNRHKRKR